MKKIILTLAAVAGASFSGFSQGQVAFDNANANGYVIVDPAGDQSSSKASYTQAASFDVACYSLASSITTTSGLTGLDAYGYLNPLDLTSDGFTQDAVAGSLAPLVGSAGAFGPQTAAINGVLSANAVIAVVAWTGGFSTYAAALASGTSDVGILVFVNAVGPASPSPYTQDIATGLDALENSPASAANGGNDDFILSPVPEPGTMALAGLGSLSLFLLRRKK